MTPELMYCMINQQGDHYCVLAFDENAEELYVQVGSELYIVDYEDISPVHSFDPLDLRKLVLTVGQIFDQACSPMQRLSA